MTYGTARHGTIRSHCRVGTLDAIAPAMCRAANAGAFSRDDEDGERDSGTAAVVVPGTHKHRRRGSGAGSGERLYSVRFTCTLLHLLRLKRDRYMYLADLAENERDGKRSAKGATETNRSAVATGAAFERSHSRAKFKSLVNRISFTNKNSTICILS